MWRDAVVIGGGPAGATAATLLARAGWSVAIVEASPFPRRKVCGEFLSATNLPLLRELGVVDQFLRMAGPPVERVAVFGGNAAAVAEMPRVDSAFDGCGRALGREHLDSLLLTRAADAGADVRQPYTCTAISGTPGDFQCTLVPHQPGHAGSVMVRAPIVIAAHGSWQPGTLPTQPAKRAARPGDLIGFKARFTGARLARGLMPLLTFPGGYGGMVHTDHDCVSFSCCVRRDVLERCRAIDVRGPAGAAVLAYVSRHCEGVRDALSGAVLDPGGWRAAGPIRPGIRIPVGSGFSRTTPSIFLIGNAAGEAHPAVAEGISMAMQSAWLLSHHLIRDTADEYNLEWRRAFAPRIRAAALIAQWAMRPTLVSMTIPLLRLFPALLTGTAKTTGKVSVLCTPHSEPA